MLTVVDLLDSSEKSLKVEEMAGEIASKTYWIDIVSPTDEEISSLASMIGVPENLLRLSTLQTYAEFHALEKMAIIHFPSIIVFEPRKVNPLVAVLSKNLLITIRMREMEAVEKAKRRLPKEKSNAPTLVLHLILDEIIENYFGFVEAVEGETAELEENILENPRTELLARIFELKSRLVSFNKLLWYERSVLFSLKTSELPFMTVKTRTLYDSLHDDIAKIIDIVETFREILSDAIDVYVSSVSSKVNSSIKDLTVVMLYLTIIATVTSFPNTVATIFGIPALGMQTDPLVILVIVVVSSIVPLVWLMRVKWLRLLRSAQRAEEAF